MPNMDIAERAVAVRGLNYGQRESSGIELNAVRRPRGRRRSHARLSGELRSH